MYTIDEKSMKLLPSNMKMDDNILGYYATLINIRSFNQKLTHAYSLNTNLFTFTCIHTKTDDEKFGKVSKDRKRMLSFSNYDSLIVPVNDKDSNHWKLFYVEFKKQKITLIDSCKVNQQRTNEHYTSLKDNILKYWLLDESLQQA